MPQCDLDCCRFFGTPCILYHTLYSLKETLRDQCTPTQKVMLLLFIINPLIQENTNTHICRIKGCGGAGCPPPPIIFERLKLPKQIIYRRKENLSESPNHQKYWKNILVSRFYEQFSRNRRNLGHFRKFEKISNS